MNWKNYCIVKFDTGEFAIRKGWFIYKYLDLSNSYFGGNIMINSLKMRFQE